MPNSEDFFFFSHISNFRRLYAKALSTRLEPYQVRPGYIDILNRLWKRDNITQKQLHAQLAIEQATLSNSLKRMERDGLIHRKRDPKDRRLSHIVLTEQAISLEPTIQTAIEELQSVINVGLTINDRRYFNRILKQMTSHLESDIEDPCLVLLDEVGDE